MCVKINSTQLLNVKLFLVFFMKKSILFATGNEGKVKEVAKQLLSNNISISSLNSISTEFEFAEETGSTFLENAIIKARHYYNIFGQPIISDDSGLVVPALNNQPGVLSARFAGEDATYKENNELLQLKIKDVPQEKRSAYFKTVIIFKDDKTEKVFEGTCNGQILESLRGEQGFGYDPLFLVPELGKTFAELDVSEKNRISHRGQAIKKLIDFLNNYNF
jgi:XTP/dITP diphosphohydrolase